MSSFCTPFSDSSFSIQINKKDTNTSFIIRWNEETSFTKYYTEELTRTPEELYTSNFLGGIIPKILFKILPGSNKFGVEGPVAYWFSSIGRFPEGIETPMRQSMLRVGSFATQQRQIMLKNVVSRLGSKDQLMAGTDCGFSTFGGFGKIDEAICYAKLSSLVEGTVIASKLI